MLSKSKINIEIEINDGKEQLTLQQLLTPLGDMDFFSFLASPVWVSPVCLGLVYPHADYSH